GGASLAAARSDAGVAVANRRTRHAVSHSQRHKDVFTDNDGARAMRSAIATSTPRSNARSLAAAPVSRRALDTAAPAAPPAPPAARAGPPPPPPPLAVGGGGRRHAGRGTCGRDVDDAVAPERGEEADEGGRPRASDEPLDERRRFAIRAPGVVAAVADQSRV